MGRFVRDEAGSVQIEYVLVGSLIALTLITALTRLGGKVNGILIATSSALSP